MQTTPRVLENNARSSTDLERQRFNKDLNEVKSARWCGQFSQMAPNAG